VSSVKTDRRVRRSRQLLRSALLSLIQEKGYDRITVQEILDRADVGRSTFYTHYRDKDDLLRSGFDDIRAALDMERAAAEGRQARKSEFLRPMLTVFEHVERHRHFWAALTKKGGADLITRILRESVDGLVTEHFRTQFPGRRADQLRLETCKQFVSGACMGLLIWWLDNDVSYTAEEIHSIFRRMAAPGVRRYLADS
jgi:AcrR family transcriptional regulator